MSSTGAPTPMSLTDVVRTSVVVVVAQVLQVTLVDAVQLRGAHADLLLLVAVAAGYVAGPDRGASVGFAVGLVADLFLPTTFGLSALVDCLLGFSAGLATASLVRSPWWPAPLVLGAGAAAGTVGYAVLSGILGTPHVVHAYLVQAVIMTAVGGVVLAPVVVAAVRWAVPEPGATPASTIGSGGSATASRRPMASER